MKRTLSIKALLFWGSALASGSSFAQSVAYSGNDNEKGALTNQVALNAEADDEGGIPPNETFGPVFHKVGRGETIESIAQQFGLTVEQFNKWNFLPDGIKPGMKVAVKFSWNKINNPDRETTESPKVTASIDKYHRVEPKETLYHISVIYHVTVDELKAWNNLRDNKIAVNQKLIVGK